MNATAMKTVPYEGSWKTKKMSLGIEMDINTIGTQLRTMWDSIPYQALFVDENGKALLSLIIHNVYAKESFYIDIADYTQDKTEYSRFDHLYQLKQWLDKKGIQNRSHYRKAWRQVRDFRRRLKLAKKMERKLNKRLGLMAYNKERAGLFGQIVGNKEFLDTESLETALKEFRRRMDLSLMYA